MCTVDVGAGDSRWWSRLQCSYSLSSAQSESESGCGGLESESQFAVFPSSRHTGRCKAGDCPKLLSRIIITGLIIVLLLFFFIALLVRTCGTSDLLKLKLENAEKGHSVGGCFWEKGTACGLPQLGRKGNSHTRRALRMRMLGGRNIDCSFPPQQDPPPVDPLRMAIFFPLQHPPPHLRECRPKEEDAQEKPTRGTECRPKGGHSRGGGRWGKDRNLSFLITIALLGTQMC